MHTKEQFFTLLVYADDVLVTGTYEATTLKLKKKIHKIIENIGYTKYFLSLEITLSFNGTNNQHKYILDILNGGGLLGVELAPTPLTK